MGRNRWQPLNWFVLHTLLLTTTTKLNTRGSKGIYRSYKLLRERLQLPDPQVVSASVEDKEQWSTQCQRIIVTCDRTQRMHGLSCQQQGEKEDPREEKNRVAGGRKVTFVRGTLERVLELCKWTTSRKTLGRKKPLSSEKKDSLLARAAEEGRVLAVACHDGPMLRGDGEREFCFLGMLSIGPRPVDRAAEKVTALIGLGLKVILLASSPSPIVRPFVTRYLGWSVADDDGGGLNMEVGENGIEEELDGAEKEKEKGTDPIDTAQGIPAIVLSSTLLRQASTLPDWASILADRQGVITSGRCDLKVIEGAVVSLQECGYTVAYVGDSTFGLKAADVGFSTSTSPKTSREAADFHISSEDTLDCLWKAVQILRHDSVSSWGSCVLA